MTMDEKKVVPMPKAPSKEGPTMRSVAKYVYVGSERRPYLEHEDGPLRPSLC